ncbi:MAG: S9 family peptidase [Bacteroidales bacterium]|nr:S9 family peptidase [Bacteroidales bacterium]
MRTFPLLLLTAGLTLAASQARAAGDTLAVTSFRHYGPISLAAPARIDSVNIQGKGYDPLDLLSNPEGTALVRPGGPSGPGTRIPTEAGLHLLGFSVETPRFAQADLLVEGLPDYRLFVDGAEKAAAGIKLEPGTHAFALKYLCHPKQGEGSPSIRIASARPLTLREDGRRLFSLDLNTQGESCSGISVSPGGQYYSIGHSLTGQDGRPSSWHELIRHADGQVIGRRETPYQWMPVLPQDATAGRKSARKAAAPADRFWYTRPGLKGRDLIVEDPAAGTQTLWAADIPEGHFDMVPGERFLLFSLEQEGPKEGEVHQILTPDDRQPGWRDRSYLALYDRTTGLTEPLTWGWHNVWLLDIAADGSKILFQTSRERLSARPTTLYSLFVMDLASRQTECIVEDDGFLNGASFSPDAEEILVTGSPEALDGIGKQVLPGQTPNSFDLQLFAIRLADRRARALTRDFAPSILDARWSRYDGLIYATAEDKDCKNLFRIDPADGTALRLPNQEEYLYRFDLADTAPVLAYYGQSLCNGDRAYVMDTRSLRQDCVRDLDAIRFGDVDFGEGGAFEFTSSRGDRINGFYVLPPDFDPAKKYPMLVHYYGGCSPSARYCYGSYSPQVYAAQGYVFYVVNPSGAAGFGQEFAARHVNTAGEGVAEDILEAVEQFCQAHPFVDRRHIGCFSASYGGFMTQLLLQKSDIFAAGVSHAGISDHTSYWGEGYWGYSYSETSMADSYPWTRKDLYVDRSPLYNADQIHTPLLFLHGSADTNVPIGESIQMFTALKLLGCETAFVVVDGENHGIREYGKRRQWLRTIFAWFAKYLQDDPAWWDELYPEKHL